MAFFLPSVWLYAYRSDHLYTTYIPCHLGDFFFTDPTKKKGSRNSYWRPGDFQCQASAKKGSWVVLKVHLRRLALKSSRYTPPVPWVFYVFFRGFDTFLAFKIRWRMGRWKGFPRCCLCGNPTVLAILINQLISGNSTEKTRGSSQIHKKK